MAYKDNVKQKVKDGEVMCGKCGNVLKLKKETLVCTNSACDHVVDISNW